MDITNAIVGLQSAKTMSRVQYAVARKMLDMQQLQGQAAVKMIGAAGKSMNLAGDALVAAATGLGSQLDTYA